VLMFNVQGIPEYRRIPRERPQCWRHVLKWVKIRRADAAGLYPGQHAGGVSTYLQVQD
jgi:hypothetical protein